VVTGAEDVTFRDIKVSWDAGSATENGAYAVYPVNSSRVIVEDSEVVGAADAGIYVGQCNQAIVRNNVVYGNVAGIEIWAAQCVHTSRWPPSAAVRQASIACTAACWAAWRA
jgi:nitrous oxidase accessory protein NosD